MAFIREIKKGGQIYRYKYESKRVNGKVKSIYLGKEIVEGGKHKSKKETKKILLRKVKHHSAAHTSRLKAKIIHRSDRWVIDNVIDFNKLAEETRLLVIENKVEAAANHYNKLLELYGNLSEQVTDVQRAELYNKTKEIYESISEVNH